MCCGATSRHRSFDLRHPACRVPRTSFPPCSCHFSVTHVLVFRLLLGTSAAGGRWPTRLIADFRDRALQSSDVQKCLISAWCSITGPSSGVGQSTARLLFTRAYRVFGTSRNPAIAETIPGVEMRPLDVRADDAVRACVEPVSCRGGRIDVLINNASSRRATRFNAPRGSPATSAHAAADQR